MRLTRQKKLVAGFVLALSVAAYFGLPWLDRANRLMSPTGRQILEGATEIELVGVTPLDPPGTYKEDGTLKISDPQLRRRIIDGLFKDIREGQEQAMCFWPHHVIRAKQGEDQIELVICFSCSSILAKFGERRSSCPIAKSSERLFHQLLFDAGIWPKPPKAEVENGIDP